jgi:hypothetical protein
VPPTSALLHVGGSRLLGVRDAVALPPPSGVDLRQWWPGMGWSRSSHDRSGASPVKRWCAACIGALVAQHALGDARLGGGVGLPSARWPQQ